MRIFEIGPNWIDVSGNQLASNLKGEDASIEFNAMIDGMETLLLALHCEGLRLEMPMIRRAIETALEAIVNHDA